METLQQIAGVTTVLGLLAAMLWWLRRRGLASFPGLPARRKGGMLQSIERLALSPQHTLHLVRVGGRRVLIGVSPAGCQVIESSPWMSTEEETAKP